MPNLDESGGQFWPFPYLALFSSYRTRFGLAAARGRGPTVRALPGVETHHTPSRDELPDAPTSAHALHFPPMGVFLRMRSF